MKRSARKNPPIPDRQFEEALASLLTGPDPEPAQGPNWLRLKLLGVTSDGMLGFVEKTVQKFKSFAEGEKSDRGFYKKLSPQERLNILLKLSEHEPERRLERVYRVIKLPRH